MTENPNSRPVTFNELVELEPRLRDLLDCVRSAGKRPNYCEMDAWAGLSAPPGTTFRGFSDELEYLVGWKRGILPSDGDDDDDIVDYIPPGDDEYPPPIPEGEDPRLYTKEAFDVAFERLYWKELPYCRPCRCRGENV